MKIETFQCDVCNKLKKATNHWYCVFRCDTYVSIFAFDERIENAKHVCGKECLMKVISEDVDKLKGMTCKENTSQS